MRKLVLLLVPFILFVSLSCSNTQAQKSNSFKPKTEELSQKLPLNSATSATQDDPWKKIDPTKVNRITTEDFKKLVFDYTKSQVWKYQGDRPCIIDFYADWCRPCRYVSPIMEELAKEYNGQIYFYKVNVDQERELAAVFGIRSIPSVLFCPKTGQPQMAIGAMPKENYIKAIQQIFGISHP